MAKHLFQPGQSGNPAGKPKGAGDKRLEIRRLLEKKGKEVVDKLLDMALIDGDPTAMKLIMERISPKPRVDSVNLGIQVNSLSTRDEIRAVIGEVMSGAITGDVPDDQAKSIVALAKTASDMDDKIDMAKRLEALEAKFGINNQLNT